MSKPLVLRHRDFFLLWTSQVLSQAGNRMFQIAVAWWILSNISESSGTYLAIFMVLGSLPSIFLVKWIGRVIDRNPSRRVLLTNDTLGITLTLILTFIFSHQVHIAAILASGLLFALFQGMIEPTLNKAVPELVEEQDISSAVAFLSSTQTLANFFGAVMGAVLIDQVGLIGITLINGSSYLVSAVCDGIIRFDRTKAESSGAKADNEKAEGWKILEGKPLIKKILLTFGCVNFFGTPILVILPIYTKQVLQASASTLGVLEACIWLGILSGTFFSSRLGLKERALLFTSICLFSFGAFLSLPAIMIHKVFYGFCLAGAGFSLGAMNVRMISLFQEIIPNTQKGRFFALLQALISFAIPIGYFTFAALSDVLETRYLCLLQGGGVILLSVFFVTYSKHRDELLSYKNANLDLETSNEV